MDVEAEIRDRKRRVSGLEDSFGILTEQVKAFTRPGIVGSAMRDVLSEPPRKSRKTSVLR